MNELVKRNHQIYLLEYHEYGNILDDKYIVDPGIQTIFIDRRDFKTYNDYSDEMHNVISGIHPDVMIAVMWPNFERLLKFTQGLDIPIIASDHSSFYSNTSEHKKDVRYNLYKQADAVVVLTTCDQELMKDYLQNTVVIYNPLSFPRLNQKTSREKTVLCAGRLAVYKIKGFDLMIDIWGQIAHKHPDWTLKFAGDYQNTDTSELERLIDDNQVRDSVEFLGWRDDIEDLMKSSAIFALPSRDEGFPCVLMEAMAQGCTPVAFEIYGNIREMITDGQDGFIIPNGDLAGFAEKLDILMDNVDLRERLGRSAIESVERFEPERIVDQWESLLLDVIEKKK